jgi:maltose O-acetyltransferase
VKLTQMVAHLAAEAEALWSQPGDHLWCRLWELRQFGVRVGEGFSCRRHLHIHRYGGISIGARAAFGSYVQLMNFARIEIGDDFLCAGNLVINNGLHDPVTLQPGAQPVKIGHRVWCGTNVTILAGVTIGHDVVIGAGSLVTRSIPSNSVAYGVPARVVRPLERSEATQLWRAPASASH